MTTQTRRYNLLVVETLSKKHGFSKYYIRQCVAGSRKGITPDTIQKEYRLMSAKVEEATK